MISHAVERFLNRMYYGYEIKQVSTDTTSISSKRKKAIGQNKLLGIFVLTKYERYEITLNNWDYTPLVLVSRNGLPGCEAEIEICVDSYNKKVYWKYVTLTHSIL